MRRTPALFVLLVIFGFLGLAAWDDCALGEEDCPPACHLGCVDGCGVVTPPETAFASTTLVVLEALDAASPNSPTLGAPLPEHSPPRS